MRPPPAVPRALWRDPFNLLAFGCGAGALPAAPGTWGTLAAVPLHYFFLRQMDLWAYLALVAVLFAVGVWWCGRAARLLGVVDHPAIVWDEMVGFWLAMAAVPAPAGLAWEAAAFGLFRLFDIWKPWPIRLLEHAPGGWGIMTDDLMAGVYAGGILLLFRIAAGA